MKLMLTTALALILSALATHLAIPWLQRQGVVAHENERTMHSGVIPKGGGLLLLLSAAISVSAFHPLAEFNWALVAGVVMLAAISWRDDTGHLPAAIRLPVHLAVASLFVWSLPVDARVFQGLLPVWLDAIVTVIALAWMMNLYNFMDGINGIVGAETVAICAGYLLLGTFGGVMISDVPLAAAILGASLGFLVWNLREKPLVFLGDVGSVSLGFLMGTFMIHLAVKGHWAAALILPSYFLTDATLTLLMRLSRGEKPWEAHRSHFYQRAARGLGAHLPVVGMMTLTNAGLIASAVFVAPSHPWLALLAVGLIVAGLLARYETAAKAQSPGSGS